MRPALRVIAGRPYAEPVSSIEVDQAERRADAALDQPEDDFLRGLAALLLGAILALCLLACVAILLLSLERAT